MLGYSYIEDPSPVPVPPRQVNGGLYTGAPFAPNAPWGNVPIEPEAHKMAQAAIALGGAQPRTAAMMPTAPRPGNNEVVLDGFYTDFDPKMYPTMKCMVDTL